MNCLFEFILDLFHYFCICCVCRKKYKCDICGIRFRRQLYLSEHIQDEHKHIFSFEDELDELQTNNPMISFRIRKVIEDDV
jgi:hypothetical protein